MEIITIYIKLLIPYLGVEENNAKLKTTLISLQTGNTDIAESTTLTFQVRNHEDQRIFCLSKFQLSGLTNKSNHRLVLAAAGCKDNRIAFSSTCFTLPNDTE